MLKTLASAGLALALAAGPARAGAAEREDLQLFRDISNAVLRYAPYSIFDDVEARVQEGHVWLTGRVTMPYKRGDIERRVAKVAGVKTVTNDLAVLPASGFDDDLRYRIARAIYGHSNFWSYASMASPPIHIIVDRGRVTLKGVVASDVDKVLARAIAADSGAFSVTSELMTDAEARQALEEPAVAGGK